MPGSSLGTSLAVVTRHSRRGSKVTVTASVPARSESSQKIARPRSMRMPPCFHPAGRDATHGTDVADGTACAMRIIALLVPHSAFPDVSR